MIDHKQKGVMHENYSNLGPTIAFIVNGVC